MGNVGLCRPTLTYNVRRENTALRVIQAMSRGDWSLVVRVMARTANSPDENDRLTTFQNQLIINGAMAQGEYKQIIRLLNRDYVFTQQQLEQMIERAAEEKQLEFLVYMLFIFQHNTFSWRCVVRALDAFASQDEYLVRAKYVLLSTIPSAADKSLLEPIHARLQERHSDKPEMKDFVLKQLSDLIKG